MKIFRSLLRLLQKPEPKLKAPIENTDPNFSTGLHTLRCRVFACLEAGYLHVQIGFEIGFLYGAPLREIEVRHFPANCRMPNTIIEITFDKGWNVIKIELAK